MNRWSLIAVLMLSCGSAHPQISGGDVETPSLWRRDLICVTAAGEPWREVDRATIFIYRYGELTAYSLHAGSQGFRWWREKRPNGEVREYGHVSLSHYITRYVDVPNKYRFMPDPMPGSRLGYDIEPQSISVNENGEITQQFGPFTIASVIGHKCPEK